MNTATVGTKKRIGQILLERGLVTNEQIEQALTEQKKSGFNKLLGETILDMGFCSENQVVEALAEAYDMPCAELTPKLVDPCVVDQLPRDFIEKHCVLPLFKVDGKLTVAIHEPSNLFLTEEINQLANCPVPTSSS